MTQPASPDQLTDAPKDLLAQEATAWVVRLHSGAATHEDQQNFLLWRNQSLAHARAYKAAERLWNDADFNQALRNTPLSSTRQRQRTASAWLKQMLIPLALAASIAFVMVVADPITRWQADHTTAVGEQRSISLSDGSTVTLNTDSAIAVAFVGNERHIRLLKGEAYFDVRRDESKPFIIDSGNTETRVLGTRFLVRDDGKGDQVTVISGLVRVSDKADGRSVDLHPNEQATNGESGLGAVRRIDQDQASGWLRGRLTFQDAPLAQVIQELNRYLPGLTVLADGKLKAHRINARFDITRPETVLAALQETLPVKITRISPWLTLIRHRHQG